MGRRAIEISSDVWTEICTEGWFVGGGPNTFYCSQGLPEGAQFARAVLMGSKSEPVLRLIYEHPSWEDSILVPDELVPVIEVKYRSSYYSETLITIREDGQTKRILLSMLCNRRNEPVVTIDFEANAVVEHRPIPIDKRLRYEVPELTQGELDHE